MTGVLTFLEDIAGYAQAQNPESSANRPFKFATIDPDYATADFPDTLPRVTFDGESVLTVKRYQVASPYRPSASERVVMAPAGHTYVILGALGAQASMQGYGEWLTVTPATGFTATSLQGRVEPHGVIRTRGSVAKNSGDISRLEVFATLPAALRPTNNLRVPAALGNAGGEPNTSSMHVQTNGELQLLGAEAFLDNVTVVYLDGVSWATR